MMELIENVYLFNEDLVVWDRECYFSVTKATPNTELDIIDRKNASFHEGRKECLLPYTHC